MENFNNVRLFREFRRYSQKFVAHKLGKSQSALSKIENGSIQPSNDIIEQLSEILKVPKEKLYSEKPLTTDSLLPLNDVAVTLLHQLTENKKLLHEVELNQARLQKQLNKFFTSVSNKR